MKIYEKLRNKFAIKHDPTRRKLLGTGVAAGVALPLAGPDPKLLSTMQHSRAMKLARHRGDYRNSAGLNDSTGECLGDESNSTEYEKEKRRKFMQAAEYVKKNGFPELKMQEFREEARNIQRFDTDILCNRSFSVAGKLHLQRERNLERILRDKYDMYDEIRPIDVFMNNPVLKALRYYF